MDFNKLWQNFMDTVQNHYMDFSGRVGRPQFWYYILACVGIYVIAAIADLVIGIHIVRWIVGLGLLLPTAGLAARRMQDTGQNGQLAWVWAITAGIFYLLSLVIALSGPLGVLAFFFGGGWLIFVLIGLAYLAMSIIIIYFCAQPGQPEANQYGPPPPVFNPGAATV